MNILYDKTQLFLGDRLNNQDIQVLGSIDSTNQFRLIIKHEYHVVVQLLDSKALSISSWLYWSKLSLIIIKINWKIMVDIIDDDSLKTTSRSIFT